MSPGEGMKVSVNFECSSKNLLTCWDTRATAKELEEVESTDESKTEALVWNLKCCLPHDLCTASFITPSEFGQHEQRENTFPIKIVVHRIVKLLPFTPNPSPPGCLLWASINDVRQLQNIERRLQHIIMSVSNNRDGERGGKTTFCRSYGRMWAVPPQLPDSCSTTTAVEDFWGGVVRRLNVVTSKLPPCFPAPNSQTSFGGQA